ncbi:hypothetical protein JTB14_028230 [Gonioctena quinquepunctata]|nr:hypothetical protein JTB14_028230 [Gonioctena quinquepunctata]
MCSFKLIYFVIFLLNLSTTNSEISDKRLCIDKDCKKPISLARTLLNYNSPDPRILSFSANEEVKIFSKGAGSLPNLWGAEIKGKRGYVPAMHIREKRVLGKPTLIVDTELGQPVESPKEVTPDKVKDAFEVVDGTTIYDSINPSSTESPVLATSIPNDDRETPRAPPLGDAATVTQEPISTIFSSFLNQIDESNEDEEDDSEDDEEEIDGDDEDDDEDESEKLQESENIPLSRPASDLNSRLNSNTRQWDKKESSNEKELSKESVLPNESSQTLTAEKESSSSDTQVKNEDASGAEPVTNQKQNIETTTQILNSSTNPKPLSINDNKSNYNESASQTPIDTNTAQQSIDVKEDPEVKNSNLDSGMEENDMPISVDTRTSNIGTEPNSDKEVETKTGNEEGTLGVIDSAKDQYNDSNSNNGELEQIVKETQPESIEKSSDTRQGFDYKMAFNKNTVTEEIMQKKIKISAKVLIRKHLLNQIHCQKKIFHQKFPEETVVEKEESASKNDTLAKDSQNISPEETLVKNEESVLKKDESLASKEVKEDLDISYPPEKMSMLSRKFLWKVLSQESIVFQVHLQNTPFRKIQLMTRG